MLTQENMHALVDGIRVAQDGRRTALVSLRKEAAEVRDGASESLRALTRSRRRSAEQERAGRAEGQSAVKSAEALRAREARGWLRDVAGTRQGAHAVWATLTVRPGSSRLAAEVAAAAPTPATAPVDAPPGGAHAAEEAGPADDALEATEEEGAETGEASVETPERAQEFAALRERVVSLLADHPDGVRLVEIEQQFGLNRFDSTRVVHSLMEDGKVRRRDRLYFVQ
jgi:hypothetical protein